MHRVDDDDARRRRLAYEASEAERIRIDMAILDEAAAERKAGNVAFGRQLEESVKRASEARRRIDRQYPNLTRFIQGDFAAGEPLMLSEGLGENQKEGGMQKMTAREQIFAEFEKANAKRTLDGLPLLRIAEFEKAHATLHGELHAKAAAELVIGSDENRAALRIMSERGSN